MLWEGINVNIKATNMDITGPINDYVIKRVTNLGKLLQKIREKGGEESAHFEVAKSTNHHKSGLVYHADCSIVIDGEQFYSSTDKEDLYEAIDDCKNQVFSEIKKKKEKKQALYKRGAQKFKDMVRGVQFWKK